MKAETSTGFAYEVDDNIGDDYELLEILCDAEDNAFLYTKLAKYILGDEGHKSLKDHCRVDGRVSTKKIASEIGEIFTAIKSLKN